MFQPFRALGMVSAAIPFDLYQEHALTFAFTSIGKTFHIYECSKLKLFFVGHSLPAEISGLLSIGDLKVALSSGRSIYIFHRNSCLLEFKGHQKEVIAMSKIGSLLLSVGKEGSLMAWDINHMLEGGDASPVSSFVYDEGFELSCLLHPATYINKIAIAGKGGELQLWNIKSGKCIYRFRGWDSPVVCMAQSPALDIIAVGLEDGRAILLNLKTDETLMVFRQKEGKVTSLAFRNDSQSNNVLVTATTIGHLHIWDLKEKRLLSSVLDAHEGEVVGVKFIKGEPVLISNGADNSIKMWLFDAVNGEPRLLRQRSGHSLPPKHIKFYDESSILSTGKDQALRRTSIFSDALNVEFSQGKIARRARLQGVQPMELKLPIGLSVDVNTLREGQWDNIVVCHENSYTFSLWDNQNMVIGKKINVADDIPVTCCTLSPSGHMAAVGLEDGTVHVYNVQSGRHRLSVKSHKRPIVGISVNQLSTEMCVVGEDGMLKWIHMNTGENTGVLSLGDGAELVAASSNVNLMAVVTDDLVIHVVDQERKQRIRQLRGHDVPLSCVCFSASGKYVVSGGNDRIIRVWDVMAGSMMDWFLTDSVPSSLSMSPNDEYLASAHIGSVGIFLWTNRAFYGVAFNQKLDVPETRALPLTDGMGEELMDVELALTDERCIPEEPLGEGLVTLGPLPKSVWQRLAHMDTIIQRNKPIQPVEKAASAPFFLPVSEGVKPSFIVEAQEEDKPQSRIVGLRELGVESNFVQYVNADNVEGWLAYIRGLSASQIDQEMRTLAGDEIANMIDFFYRILARTLAGYEEIHAYLHLFLKIHADTLREDERFKEGLVQLQQLQEEKWKHLQSLFQSNLYSLSFFSKAF